MRDNKIYIILSYTDTWPGRLIVFRATLKFWNRYSGDSYSHVSISTDKTLTRMYSFARKTIHNPFNAGLVKESIYAGLFCKQPDKNKIAVFELAVTDQQYRSVNKLIHEYWKNRAVLKFNFLGLFFMLLFARGITRRDHFFCSQWVTTVLKKSGIELFDTTAVNVRPFDYYDTLRNNLLYEGTISGYSQI